MSSSYLQGSLAEIIKNNCFLGFLCFFHTFCYLIFFIYFFMIGGKWNFLNDFSRTAGSMSQPSQCGLCGYYPKWLKNSATTRNFICVYSFLGTIQAMAFIYIVVTLTTLEKRFKIPSQTTGKFKTPKKIKIFNFPISKLRKYFVAFKS